MGGDDLGIPSARPAGLSVEVGAAASQPAVASPDAALPRADVVVSPLRDVNVRVAGLWADYLKASEKMELDEAKSLLRRAWGETGYVLLTGKSQAEWIQDRYRKKLEFVAEVGRRLQAGEGPTIKLLLEKMDGEEGGAFRETAHYYRTFGRQLEDHRVENALIETFDRLPVDSSKAGSLLKDAFDHESRGGLPFAHGLYQLLPQTCSDEAVVAEAQRGLRALQGDSDFARSVKKTVYGLNIAEIMADVGVMLLSSGAGTAIEAIAVRLFGLVEGGAAASLIGGTAFGATNTVGSLAAASLQHDPKNVWTLDNVSRAAKTTALMGGTQALTAKIGGLIGMEGAKALGWMESGGVAASAQGETLILGARQALGLGGAMAVTVALDESAGGTNDAIARSLISYAPWGFRLLAAGGKVFVTPTRELDPAIKAELIAHAEAKLALWEKNPNARMEFEDFFLKLETGHLPPAERQRVLELWSKQLFAPGPEGRPSVAEATSGQHAKLIPVLEELMPTLHANFYRNHNDGNPHMTDPVVCRAGNCESRGRLVISIADRRGMGAVHAPDDARMTLQPFTDHIQPIVKLGGSDGRQTLFRDPITGTISAKMTTPLYDPAITYFLFLKSQGRAGSLTEGDFVVHGQHPTSGLTGGGGPLAHEGSLFGLLPTTATFGPAPAEGILPAPLWMMERTLEGTTRAQPGWIARNPRAAVGGILGAGVLGMGGVIRLGQAKDHVDPKTDESNHPTLRKMRGLSDEAYRVTWGTTAPGTIWTLEEHETYKMEENRLILGSLEQSTDYLSLKNDGERIDYLASRVSAKIAAATPKDVAEKLYRLTVDPHTTITELNAEDLERVAGAQRFCDAVLMEAKSQLPKHLKNPETVKRLERAVLAKNPAVADVSLSRWCAWIEAHPSEYAAFLNTLPPEKLRVVVETAPLRGNALDRLQVKTEGAADDADVSFPVFGRVLGRNITPVMAVESEKPNTWGDGSSDAVPPDARENKATDAAASGPEAAENRRPSTKGELTPRTAAALYLKAYRYSLDTLRDKWTPGMTAELLNMNQNGDWDEYIHQLTPGVENMRVTPSLERAKDLLPVGFSKIIDAVYQRHPEWYSGESKPSRRTTRRARPLD